MHLIKAQTKRFDLLSLCPRANLPAVASTLRGGIHSFQSLGLAIGAFG